MNFNYLIKSVLAILITTVCVGCASDSDMREKFGDNKYHTFIHKSTGDEYVIKHHFGDNYQVRAKAEVLHNE